MCSCLTHSTVKGTGIGLDHRYFYRDTDGLGCYTSGLAREAITEFLRETAEDSIFLGDEWLLALEDFENNECVQGYIVENILISHIASAGLKTGDIQIEKSTIVTFDGEIAKLSTSAKNTLY